MKLIKVNFHFLINLFILERFIKIEINYFWAALNDLIGFAIFDDFSIFGFKRLASAFELTIVSLSLFGTKIEVKFLCSI